MKDGIEVHKSLEDLAVEIEKLAGIGHAITHSRLKKRAILLLIQDITLIPRGTIEKVLDALPKLADEYVKPKLDIKEMLSRK